ncbi:hypothetical protein BB560_006106 [Smittium megazygosporum]|uniref:Methionyl/Leucyl tRNA synthetase domain-containing protein n=1 Tax=Smittium megazygosporum TaxID=133381 RepID=A0A2T9YHG6_9FUNG|nr:hypothetical protein BB560_006106 [Smittium megazygosporum]
MFIRKLLTNNSYRVPLKHASLGHQITRKNLFSSLGNKNKVFVATPIFYVNAAPHIGHVYSSVLADILTRFYALQENSVKLSTGTDEHGLKVRHSSFLDNEISKIPTSEPNTYEYISNETGSKVEWTQEENYKFRLSKFNDILFQKIKSDEILISPESRKNEILSWLKNGIQDISVSRPKSRLSWGIPVPNDDTQTIYVWIDALTNYLTVDGFYDPSYTSPNFFPPTYHIVGKDILKFHAVYWPALLLGADLPLPRRIVAHGHWTIDDSKMSKSKGNVADPIAAINEFGVDAFRYFLARDGDIGFDNNYSEKNIQHRYNTELVAHLGNFISRCLSSKLGFNSALFANVVDQISKNGVQNQDLDLHNNLLELPSIIEGLYKDANFSKVLVSLNQTLSLANKHFSNNEPWNLTKNSDPSNPSDRLTTVGFYSLETIRIVSILLSPIIPTKSSQILDTLNTPNDQRSWKFSKFGSGWAKFLDSSSPLKQNISHIFPRKL